MNVREKRPVIFLDTSAIISLVDSKCRHHDAMVAFFDVWSQEECTVRVIVSAIAVAEYTVKDDFPKQLFAYFDMEAFGLKAAEKAGSLRRAWDAANGKPKSNVATRDQIKDDFKIVAYAISEGADVIITADAASLAKYAAFANQTEMTEMIVWTLDKGFDVCIAKGEPPDLVSNQV